MDSVFPEIRYLWSQWTDSKTPKQVNPWRTGSGKMSSILNDIKCASKHYLKLEEGQKVKRINLMSHKFPQWSEIMNMNYTGGDK